MTKRKRTKADEASSSDKPAGESDNRGVYCGGIAYSQTEANIREWFSEWCGPIESIEMLKWPGTEEFRGIAIIIFETSEAAETALTFHHSEWDGHFLTIKSYDSSKRNKAPKVAKTEEAGQEKADADEKPAEEGNEAEEGPFLAYVGNLEWEVTEDEMWEWVTSNGSRRQKVVDVRLKETETRKFAFIEFGTKNMLDQAVATLNQLKLKGRPAKVMVAATKAKTPKRDEEKPAGDGCSVIVRCLPKGLATPDTIRRLFNGHKVKDVYVPRNSETFGFVRFATPKAAQTALCVDGAKINGEIIRVKVAEKGRN